MRTPLHKSRVGPPQVLSQNEHPCKRSPSEPPRPNLRSRQRHHRSPARIRRLHQQLHHALRPRDVLVIPRRRRCPTLLAMPVRRQAAGLRLRLQHVVSVRAHHHATARVVVKRSLRRDMSLGKGCDLAAQRTRTPWPMRPWIRRLEAAHAYAKRPSRRTSSHREPGACVTLGAVHYVLIAEDAARHPRCSGQSNPRASFDRGPCKSRLGRRNLLHRQKSVPKMCPKPTL